MISFVIPAYNEAGFVGHTVAALRHAAAGLSEPHEIVVVDDDSSDRTAEIAERAGARVVRARHRQISATRNTGARAARGDLLLFVDADTLVPPEVVAAAVRAMRSGAVGGGAHVRFDEPLPPYARALRFLLPLVMRCSRLAAGCFLFCTRQAFDAVGGFDPGLFGAEEIAMSRALKRVGRFVVLNESVLSSGRKMRLHSGREILRTVVKLTLGGWASLRDRSNLELWYRPRREHAGDREERRSA